MPRAVRQKLPEIIFFCVTFMVTSGFIRIHYRLFSEIIESILLKLGLHFSYWSASLRSCVMLAAAIGISALIFLLARYACSIQKEAGKGRLLLPALLILSVLIILCIFCELQVFRRDDFWEVQYSRELGLFGFMGYALRTEGGRYFSYFMKGISAFFPTARSVMTYMNTCLFISLLALFGGLYRLLLVFLRTSADLERSVSEKKTALLFAFCLFTAVLFTSPKIWEDWFWDAGGLIFGIGITLSVWAFTLILEDIFLARPRRRKLIAATLILFIGCGCNQITTLAMDILISEVLLYVFITRRDGSIRRRILYYFAITAAASAICILAPGNFYRFDAGPFESTRSAETGELLKNLIPRLYQQIAVNIRMMKTYWILLIVICFFLGTIVSLRHKKELILLAAAMLPAGFFSLSINYVLDYMPSRIYAAAFIWFVFSAALLSATAGSMFHDLLRGSVLPVRILPAYVFLAVIVSALPVLILFRENHRLLLDIRSAWFYRDEQIHSVPASKDETREICGVPVIETNGTDIRLAEAFIANYYGLGRVEDVGVCPPFKPVSDDPALWR